MTLALELQGVTAGYGRATAIRDISFAVPEGACLALLGANGAGKTTTLRTISGLLRPRRGHVLLDGRPITGRPPWAITRLGVGHVPEGRGVVPSLSVAKNLGLGVFSGPIVNGTLSDDVAHLFPRLTERLSQVAGTMSGGEQQMLAVARVLEMKPRVLLLDELSLGLAPVLVHELFNVVRAIHQAGTTVVLVEQFVSKAMELADYVAILAKGQLTFVGEPGELVGRDSDELIAAYMGGVA